MALETSGTEVGHVGANIDWVCVSPKINMPGGRPIVAAAMRSAHEIKHVVGKGADIEQLDQLLAQSELRAKVQICLQPVSQSQKATDLCLEVVQQRGWRLSLQMHKYLGAR